MQTKAAVGMCMNLNVETVLNAAAPAPATDLSYFKACNNSSEALVCTVYPNVFSDGLYLHVLLLLPFACVRICLIIVAPLRKPALV